MWPRARTQFKKPHASQWINVYINSHSESLCIKCKIIIVITANRMDEERKTRQQTEVST